MSSIRSGLVFGATLLGAGAIALVGAGGASADSCGLLNRPSLPPNCGVLNNGYGNNGIANNLLSPGGLNNGLANGGVRNIGIGNNLLSPGGYNNGILNQGTGNGFAGGLNVLNLGVANNGILNIGTGNTGIANIGTGHSGILGGVLGP
jgi:hypothetical protein